MHSWILVLCARASALRGDFMGCRDRHVAPPAYHKTCCRGPSYKDIQRNVSLFSAFPNITKYSCLAQITLKINDLEWFWFVQ